MTSETSSGDWHGGAGIDKSESLAYSLDTMRRYVQQTAGSSIDMLRSDTTNDMRRELIASMQPYLDFEFASSDVLAQGKRIIVSNINRFYTSRDGIVEGMFGVANGWQLQARLDRATAVFMPFYTVNPATHHNALFMPALSIIDPERIQLTEDGVRKQTPHLLLEGVIPLFQTIHIEVCDD